MRIKSHTTLLVGEGKKAEYIEPGKAVELDDEEAADLIKRGFAVKAGKAEVPVPEKTDLSKNNTGNGQATGNQGGNGQGGKQQ
jgi:hypothetical protein